MNRKDKVAMKRKRNLMAKRMREERIFREKKKPSRKEYRREKLNLKDIEDD